MFFKGSHNEKRCEGKLTRWSSEIPETNSDFKPLEKKKKITFNEKQSLLSIWEGKLNSLQKNILTIKIYYLVKKHMKMLILLSSENSYGLIWLFRHSPTQQGYLRTAFHAGRHTDGFVPLG